MIFYFSFFIVTLFISLLSVFFTRIQNNELVYTDPLAPVSIIYTALIVFFVIGFRFEVGTDYKAYIGHVEDNILTKSFLGALKEEELFFIIFSKLSYLIVGDMKLFYIVIALFTIFFLFRGIVYYSKNIILSIFIFYISTCFFITLNAMRQMAAFAVFIYASRYIYERKLFKYLFYMMLGFCWHKCTVFYIFCYFLPIFRINKSIYFFIPFIFIVKKIINFLIVEILGNFGINMNYYFLMVDGASSKTYIVISFFILLYFYFFVDRETKEMNFLFNICLIEFFITVLADGIPGSFRLVYLFYPMYIVICPEEFRKSKNKFYGKLFLVVITFMFAYYFYNMQIRANANEVVPYHSLFEYLF